MSTIDVGLLLSRVDRRALTRGADAPLRVVLVEGEALRLPRGTTQMRVLTGSAWISQAGRDSFVQAGERFHPAGGRDPAVLSPLGRVPLLVEMR